MKGLVGFVRISLSLLVILSIGFLFNEQSYASQKKKKVKKKVEVSINLSTKGNNIAFDQKSVQVQYGKKVEINFTNKAKKDSGITHNVIVIRAEDEEEILEFMDSDEIDWELDKVKGDKRFLAQSKTLAPGESDSISFTPPKKGYYLYICLMPGHADRLGMKGTLHVK